MEQDQAVAVVAVWVVAADKVEAEWEGHLPQVRAETACVLTAVTRLPTLSVSRAIRRHVLNVGQE